MSSSPEAPSAAFDFEQLAPAPRRERAPSVAEASSRAQSIIAAAEADAERIRSVARQQGQAEGYAAGLVEAQAALEPVFAAMAEAVERLREQEATVAAAVEAQAAGLAVEIAEKVVAGALDVEPERVLDVIRGALRAIVERERIVVQVNPADLEIVREAMADVAASLGGIEHVDVQEERRVARGGAIVRTTVGELDARIATKLERARDAVAAELKQ
ncbi:MAG: flagellar assembly protein FliH [Thermoleophilaceae bacterium]|jgi:flagellar biosynthesis/type III secretory pathway protein FliH|nr:flagellar assembly protein FliH [Thermoleophilaceae bacterium]